MEDVPEQESGSALLKHFADFFKQQHSELSKRSSRRWEANKTYLPLQLAFFPEEAISVVDLVATDNVVMSKIIGTFASVCVEITRLKEEANNRHYPFISLIGQNNIDIVKHVDSICQLTAFVERCRAVLKNISAQMFALYETKLIILDNIDLHYIISHISELCCILIIIEFLITNSSLTSQWRQFRKTIENLHKTDYDFTTKMLKNITKVADNIETKLLNDHIMIDSLNEIVLLKQNVDSKSFGGVTKEFHKYLMSAIVSLDSAATDGLNNQILHKCIKINALFLYNSYIFGGLDKKAFKTLLDLNAKAHSIPLYGNNIWYPEQFLQRYLSTLSNGKSLQSIMKSRQSYLTNKKQFFPKELTEQLLICSYWVAEMEKTFSDQNKQMNASDISARANLLLEGLDIISKINYAVKVIVSLHLTLSLPMTKTLLKAVFTTLELQKYLENLIIRSNIAITLSINMITQHYLYQAISLTRSMKKTFMSEKKLANNKMDELTCLVVAERSLCGAATLERITVASLALSLLPINSYNQETYPKIAIILEKTQKVCDFMKHFKDDCDCSWLLWHKEMIPLYMMQNIVGKTGSYNLIAGCRIFEDCLNTIRTHDGANSLALVNLRQEIKLSFDDNIFNPFNQLLETNLRLQTHAHLHNTSAALIPVNRSLLFIEKFRLLPEYLSPKLNIEYYLSKMFYNLTTIVLSDWKTYGEMRQLAKFKYNITTVEDNLPKQTLEQGIDVLEIMRNIDTFVTKYLYNLNNQIFIEKTSSNKHLNTINIKHIANSIRTHGTGIMNTAVNFTYRFLRKMFTKFSELMYDERVKSRLVKEQRKFRDCVASGNKIYPFKYAEKLAKDIRNLITTEEGLNHLDVFRIVVSHVGNAMGYVRMIRSGGRHCCADCIAFLPKLENSNFKKSTENQQLASLIIQSAEYVDNDIDNLLTHFIHGTEYFKLLVDAFSGTFRNEKNAHLSNFYLIVPALMLNHIENMILCKDKMTKNNKAGAAFTDDGFAMGVAYIIRLLDQESNFDAFHWFQSVWNHISEERISLNEQKLKSAVNLQKALALTEKKLHILEQEFQLLYYTFTSARIFFQ